MQVTGSIDASSTISVKQVEVATGKAVSSSFAQKSAVSSSFVQGAAVSGSFVTSSAFTGNMGDISGSSVSTGSFGALAVAGKVTTHLLPTADDTYDLGSAALQWKDIYTGDFHLNNTSREEGNVIDGTKGDWTIQEGKEDLYLLNNETGKKYKFNLTEIE